VDRYHTPKPFYRPKKKRWYVQLDGKQINLGPDESEARRRYHALMTERLGDTPQPQPPTQAEYPTVAAVVDEYFGWLKGRVGEGSKARRTLDWYAKYLKSFLRFLRSQEVPPPKEPGEPPALTVEKLEPIHVYRWVDANPTWKTGKRGAMTSVQRAFNWAARAGLLKSLGGRSPLASLEKPPQGRREQLVTEAEYAEVLSALTCPRARDLVELSWETGMRPHELFTAEARFFEPDNARLVFPVRLSKGKKVQRVVYLNDKALRIVSAAAAANSTGPLLRNSEGNPWRMASVNCLFQRVRRELGRRRLHRLGLLPPKIPRMTAPVRKDKTLRAEQERKVLARRKEVHRLAWEHGIKYSLYAFRHAFCTEALENGVDAVTVSVLMGHRDTTMISRVYSHLTQRQEHLRDAANRARGA
jgi:integrase